MTKSADNLIWIIGQGGLLGSALIQQISPHTTTWTLWSPLVKFNWKKNSTLLEQFKQSLEEFEKATTSFQGWTILWCAGAGVIGTNENDLHQETENYSSFLKLLDRFLTGNSKKGAFFLASSAGGIWAGAKSFPITESSPPCPISEYGRQKLAHEDALKILSLRHPNLQVLVGRISNLYGPGQNLEKPQGLLSQLCRSALLQVPMNIFVSLNTTRDYIHTCDAAETILRSLKQLGEMDFAPNYTTKIICSEEECSISQILSCLNHLSPHPPLVSHPENLIASQQPQELIFRSKCLVSKFKCRPLFEGLNELLCDQETQFQLGSLPFPKAV
jgi:UDP-glucose 4-epimerase